MHSTLKILQIIPDLAKGGAERLVLDICNELSGREDVEVKLITFSDYNLYPDLTENISWEVIPVNIQLSLWKPNKIDIIQLQRAIEDFKPNVIHTHLFFAEMATRFCFYPQVKWFSHGHDNMIQFAEFSLGTVVNKSKLTALFEKRLLFKNYKKNGGTHFISISKNACDYFNTTAKPFKNTLLFNAIKYERFFKEKEEQSQKLNLVNVGSLVDKKNQTFLIDVAAELFKQKIDFELHLLGDGSNFRQLNAKIKELGLKENVFLHGNVANVEEFYWKASIYVHSATYEPLGLVLIEAMAAGLPVVTLDGKGNRDLMVEGKNGFLLKENSANEFSSKILELWNDKTAYSKISKYAQDFASRFNIKEYVDSLLKLYKE